MESVSEKSSEYAMIITDLDGEDVLSLDDQHKEEIAEVTAENKSLHNEPHSSSNVSDGDITR